MHRRAPAVLRPWLDEQASLTARLARFCGGPVRVRVLREQWARPLVDEARALGVRPQQHVWVREVLLRCRGTSWVYARTVMPRESLRGRQRALLRLGERPLGSVLFARTPVTRSPLTFRCLGERHRLFQAIARHVNVTGPLWARRSILSVSGRGVLVAEVFLPMLVEQLAERGG